MDLYQQYIHISRYSRWRDDLGRRETWEETVQRYVDFFDEKTDGNTLWASDIEWLQTQLPNTTIHY